MKLFTKEIDNKLFDQYQKGSDLENQKVVAKIFNPYGRGTWYLLNSDPQDPDYIWAIVDLFEVEMGSVSRSELESIKVPPFGLGLERDLSFTPINAYELYMGLLNGKQYAEGGMMAKGGGVSVDLFEFYDQQPPKLKKIVNKWASKYDEDELDYKQTEKFLKEVEAVGYTFDYGLDNMPYGLRPIGTELEMDWEQGGIMANGGQTSLFEEGGSVAQQNKEMLKNQAKEFMHHSQELNSLVDNTKQVDAWVVAKAERASTDLSDITHYLDGRMMAKGGNVIDIKKIEKEYNSNEKYNLHSENVVLLAENFGTEEELAEAEDILKQHQEQGSLSTELYNRRSVLEDILWKKFQTMKKVVMAKGGRLNVVKKYNTISEYLKDAKSGDLVLIGRDENDLEWIGDSHLNKFVKIDEEGEGIFKIFGRKGLVSFPSNKNVIVVDRKYEDGGIMAKGGATFKDKVNAISKRLEGTKVPTRLKKDYGATYDKKEAKQAGQRIAGSMIQKLKMRNK